MIEHPAIINKISILKVAQLYIQSCSMDGQKLREPKLTTDMFTRTVKVPNSVLHTIRMKLWIFSYIWKSEKNVLERIYLLSLLGSNMIAFDNLAYACVYYNASCLSFFSH